MNIFVLSTDPVEAAQQQADKHVVKMAVESAQMLSIAHRFLDGIPYTRPSKSGKRMIKDWCMEDSHLENILYKIGLHLNHPCSKWTYEVADNYSWHYDHWCALCEEYKYRYGRDHLSYVKLKDILANFPKNIPSGSMTPHPLAMKQYPECMNSNDIVGSYRAFYQTKEFSMVWTNRDVPNWYKCKGTSDG